MPHAFPVELGPPSAQTLASELSRLRVGADDGEAKAQLQLELAREVRAAKKQPYERSPLWWLAYEVVMDIARSIPDQWAAARKAADLKPLPFLPPPDKDVFPEGNAEYSAQLQERRALLGDAEKEVEVRNSFVESFGQSYFGPAMTQFDAVAHEISAFARVQRGAAISLRERLQPYLELQNIDGVEMGGSVIMFELDLGFLAPKYALFTPANELQTPEGMQLVLEGEDEEQVRQRLQSIKTLMESSPLSVLVMAHLGEPAPEPLTRPPSALAEPEGDDAAAAEAAGADVAASAEPTVKRPHETLEAIATRMRSLPSLEPLVDIIRDVCQDAVSQVEFVPHSVWLGERLGFAEKARSDADERRVYLLENLSAFPEELGMRRWSVAAPEQGEQGNGAEAAAAAGAGAVAGAGDAGKVSVAAVPWTTREIWAEHAFGGALKPEFLVQDSLTAACSSTTTHVGLWPGAPRRVVGPFVEAELGAFVEALQLPFRTAEADAGPGASSETPEAGNDSGAEDEVSRVPAPLLVVVGGGGFKGPRGEELALRKFELLLGLARIAHHEKDGLLLALGGEPALYVMSCVFGIALGATGCRASSALVSALKETLLEVLKTGATVLLPLDLVCEELAQRGSPTPDGGSPTGQEEPAQPRSFALASAFAAAARRPVVLGFSDGHECSVGLDPERGALLLLQDGAGGVPADGSGEDLEDAAEATEAAPAETEPAEAATGPGVPQGWAARDIGEATVKALEKALRRCRGVLWNGSLGVWEDERWQRGTRAFFAAVENRLVEQEEGDEGEDEEEEEEEGEDGVERSPRAEPEPEADFEVAVVVGSDSARVLPSLMETPSLVTFVSRSGDGLLQLLRGDAAPGLLACEVKASS